MKITDLKLYIKAVRTTTKEILKKNNYYLFINQYEKNIEFIDGIDEQRNLTNSSFERKEWSDELQLYVKAVDTLKKAIKKDKFYLTTKIENDDSCASGILVTIINDAKEERGMDADWFEINKYEKVKFV